MKEGSLKISLVVPMYNEETSLKNLIESINKQKFLPSEVILVDGGSTDKTIEVFNRLCAGNSSYRLIQTERATPGRGRNIGIQAASNEWIALTDAGIILDENWLSELAAVAEREQVDAVYGNVSPVRNSFFEKLATFAYVAPLRENVIRTKFIASSLLKRSVWQTVGGFPDLRAAEDLIFMESVESEGFKSAIAPKALVHWQLRPDLLSTFKKFTLYSKHNVWIKRHWDWHYGILRQYLLMIPFVILALVHSFWWILIIAGWLAARTSKAILRHRFEFGTLGVFNPFFFFGTMSLILLIDLAAFIGWAQAVFQKKTENFIG